MTTFDKSNVGSLFDTVLRDTLNDTQAALTKALGQLAALQQANDTLVEKWRAKATEVISPENADPDDELFSFFAGYATGLHSAADKLEAATKEATE